eukprot:CAMPEP_0171580132 /NCGR_PEP_ID=MMETSP0961-20121227/8871_1 /TAXON_ID=87120 /ORGANISM="Aurantiochytrium limacinum, Strain ATCCMYA-1381" /LENGTH=32 /DNA_ID= /DNA_START= /DNA_END= /DNA_ORIENTATION=
MDVQGKRAVIEEPSQKSIDPHIGAEARLVIEI